MTSNPNKLSISNPWDREEREKEKELRRIHGRQWRDQQIGELSNLPNRNIQQEEQLRALKLEREFERRAQEAASDPFDDDDIEEGIQDRGHDVCNGIADNTENVYNSNRNELIIKKPNMATMNKNGLNESNVDSAEISPPSPPERGSSFAIMNNLRAKDFSKKMVSFHETPSATMVQQTNHMLTMTQPGHREDPNVSFLTPYYPAI